MSLHVVETTHSLLFKYTVRSTHCLKYIPSEQIRDIGNCQLVISSFIQWMHRYTLYKTLLFIMISSTLSVCVYRRVCVCVCVCVCVEGGGGVGGAVEREFL